MKKTERRSLRERFVSLFRPEDEERQDIHYHGKPMRRLIGYLKPHRKVFFICLALCQRSSGLKRTALPMIRASSADACAGAGSSLPERRSPCARSASEGRSVPVLRSIKGPLFSLQSR